MLPAEAQGPISAALGKDDDRFWVHASARGFRGENRRNALAAEFGKEGVELSTEGKSTKLHWKTETRAYGYGSALRPVHEAAPQASANRVEYRRDGMTEWYENGPLGLEQGFTLSRRPAGASGQPLTLELGLSGDLLAALEASGSDRSGKKSKTLELRSKDGKAAFRYAGLEARDATGRELPSWLEAKGDRVLVRVDDNGARYPVVVDPWIQEAELTASDGAANYDFGFSVAVSGNTIVIGAPGATSGETPGVGAAYVFVLSGGAWTQQAELNSSDGVGADNFGSAVAVSGGTVVVGADCHPYTFPGVGCGPGAAYVFVQSGSSWSQQAELTASDGVAGDNFGYAVAVNGGTAMVGAFEHAIGSNSQQGAVYVFAQSGTSWSQQQELTASPGAADDGFGSSVAISGSTALIGAYGQNSGQGAAYVFAETGGTWTQKAELTASDGGPLSLFGYSAALSGNTAIVGSPTQPYSGGFGPGAAYVFVKSGTTWTQQAELTASDGAASDLFGASVGISGNSALVGAFGHTVNSNQLQGAAYVFTGSGGTWTQQAELTASDGGASDRFGVAVAVDNGTNLVGAEFHTVNSNGDEGAAYVFAQTTTATFTPGLLNFGNVAVDTTSAAKTVMVKNTGPAPLQTGNISIAPTGNFAISGATCGSTLAVNKTCKVNVTFTTSLVGAATATLTLNGNIDSPLTVALSATGVAQVTVTPGDVSFATTKVGSTSPAQRVILKNNLPTQLTGISFSTSAPFAVSPATTCGATLNSKKTCIIDVTFAPGQTGTATGALMVNYGASGSPQTVNLVGDGD